MYPTIFEVDANQLCISEFFNNVLLTTAFSSSSSSLSNKKTCNAAHNHINRLQIITEKKILSTISKVYRMYGDVVSVLGL